MTITEFAEEARLVAKDHGFNVDPSQDIHRALLLIIGEVVEAQEELRSGHHYIDVYHSDGGKPEGFGVELADAVIRILQLCAALGIDIEDLMREKQAYNKTRPFRHGKVF